MLKFVGLFAIGVAIVALGETIAAVRKDGLLET